MEIRGTVKGHRPDAEYRFDRTINSKSWYRVEIIEEGKKVKVWKLREESRPGTKDNIHPSDEDVFPDNDHIYSIDRPGIRGPETAPDMVDNFPAADRATLLENVFMMNATETAEVTVDGGTTWIQAAHVEWFTVSWLEKVDGVWRRKPGSNLIKVGSIDNLVLAEEPPTSF